VKAATATTHYRPLLHSTSTLHHLRLLQLIAFYFTYLLEHRHPGLGSRMCLMPPGSSFLLLNSDPSDAAMIFEALQVCVWALLTRCSACRHRNKLAATAATPHCVGCVWQRLWTAPL
jgi:hypothetical protein